MSAVRRVIGKGRPPWEKGAMRVGKLRARAAWMPGAWFLRSRGRVLEPRHAIEREEPDAQRQNVVLVQGRRQERIVRAVVDVAVDALVEVDQRPLVRFVAHVLELFQ